MSSQYNVLVVGSGYWGRRVLGEYSKLIDAGLVSKLFVFDSDFNSISNKDGRIITASKLEGLIETVDFAHVCTPNRSHFELAKMLVERGISTMVEKPLTEDPKEAEELVELSRLKSSDLRVGMLYRFSKAVNTAKGMLKDSIGEPIIIRASWLHNVNIPNIQRVMKERDVTWDIFIHLLDIINYMFDAWPTFSYSKGILGGTGFNHSFFASGNLLHSAMSIDSSFVSHKKERRVDIVGSKANMTIDILNNVLTVGNDDDARVITFRDNPLYSEISDFLGLPKNDDVRNDGVIGSMETKILWSLLQSSNHHECGHNII